MLPDRSSDAPFEATARGDSESAQIIGLPTVQSATPERFSEFVRAFSALMDECLNEQLYKVSPGASARLDDLARELAILRAGPRDVVEIYGSALRSKLREATRTRAAAYAELGQILALEFMGYLANHYRKELVLGSP